MRSLNVCHNRSLWKRHPLKRTDSTKLLFAFRSAHASYPDLLCDQDDIQDSLDYYNGECKRIEGCQLTLEKWIAKTQLEYYENLDKAVQQEDSVSNVGSRCRLRSRASHASSLKSTRGSSARHVQSPRLIAAAKRTALIAEAASLREQQALEEEELRLKQEAIKQQQFHEEAKLRLDQRKRELDLEMEIAKVEAEEHIYAIAELEPSSVRQVPGVPSQAPSIPTGQQSHPLYGPRPPMEAYTLPQVPQPEQPWHRHLPRPNSANTASVPVSSLFKSFEPQHDVISTSILTPSSK